MTKKALFLSLAAAMTIFVACGDDTDPSKNSSTGNVSTNNTSTSANNTSTNNTSPNNSTSPNSSSPNSTSPNSSSPNNTTPNNSGTCDAPSAAFFGQIGSDNPAGGGAPDLGGTYDTDANLQAVLDAMPTEEETVTLETPITVTDALIGSTGFVPTGATSPFILYVMDTNTGMEIRLPMGFDAGFDLKTGQIVSFDVTEVQNFGNLPQIANVENMVLVSEGNEVPVIDGSTTAITPADWGKIVKVGGSLPATSNGCGGDSVCYELDYGNGTITFRTDSEFIEPGACVTFVGPVRSFPGPIGNTLTAGDLQVDQLNFGWAQTPR